MRFWQGMLTVVGVSVAIMLLAGCTTGKAGPGALPPQTGTVQPSPTPPGAKDPSTAPSANQVEGWELALVPDRPFHRIHLGDQAVVGDSFDAFLATYGRPQLVSKGQDVTFLSFRDGEISVAFNREYQARTLERAFAKVQPPPDTRRTHSTTTLEEAKVGVKQLLPRDAKLVESNRMGNYGELGEEYTSAALKAAGGSGRIHVAYLENREEGSIISVALAVQE